VSLEELGEPREIGALPRESIDAIDDDAADVAPFDAPQELGEAGALERRAALALIVEAFGDRVPEVHIFLRMNFVQSVRWSAQEVTARSSPERLTDCRVHTAHRTQRGSSSGRLGWRASKAPKILPRAAGKRGRAGSWGGKSARRA
jgi:hypothetical protein